jgi:hypothetical protein
MITGAPAPSPTFLGCGGGASAGRGDARTSSRVVASASARCVSRLLVGANFGSGRRDPAYFLSCLRLSMRLAFHPLERASAVGTRIGAMPIVPSPCVRLSMRLAPHLPIAWSPRLRLSMRVAVQPSGVGVGGGRPDWRNSYLVVASPSAAAPITLPGRLSRGRILLRRRRRARSLTACPRRRPRSLRRSAGPLQATACPRG